MTDRERVSWAQRREQTSPLSAAAARAAVRAVSLINEKVDESGISNKELADRIDVTASRVSQVLNGDGNLRVSTLARFLRAAGFRLRIEADPVGPQAGDDLSDMRYVVQHRVLKGDASGVTECTSYEITSVHPRAELGRSLGWVMDTRTGAIDTAPTPVVREGAHAPRGTDSTRSQESAHVVNH